MEYFSDNNLDSQNTEHTHNTENMNTSGYSSEEDFTDLPQNNTQHTSHDKEQKPFPNVFALFAKSLGVFSIFCAVFSVFFGSFICGGLAIVLAILSKGYHTKMEKNAKIGLATGIIGIVLQISLLAVSIYNIIHVPEFREQFNTLYEQMYGVPAEDSLNDILDQMGLPTQEGGIL